MSMYVTERDEFYQAFPHGGTATEKCWDEKAWIQGYAGPARFQNDYT